ncbi:MAG: isoprenylcysteine carboxylmethyltransferase family protein [Alphaproteobacteria bacterium]|nr:isoprenylcysteine carboxylmethyltransferase family protein [Alphaproteobacteria bacterium]
MAPVVAVYILWFIWVLTWIAATQWLHPKGKHAHIGLEVVYRVLAVGGFLLLMGVQPVPRYDLDDWFWRPLDGTAGWWLFLVTLAGFVLAWWARIQLGRVWSDTLNKSHDHHVIQTGPYAVVRQPVYTGIIISSFATAAIFGLPWRLFGAVVMSAGFVIKALLEEQFLREELAEAYDDYAKRVPLLVPFWPQKIWPSQHA